MADAMFKTIIWATDGSETADAALHYARGLASRDGAALVAVHCDERLHGVRVGGLPMHPDEEEIKAKIERQVAELAAAGLDARLKTVIAPAPGAAHQIADIAGDAAADLIVVGTRGHTALAGLLVGSVTQRLLHIAPCPVFVVRPSEAGA